jgi:hypothetical protein
MVNIIYDHRYQAAWDRATIRNHSEDVDPRATDRYWTEHRIADAAEWDSDPG